MEINKKKNSKELLLKARKALKEQGISTRRKFVTINCTICKRDNRIRTNNKAIYTAEVVANYVCVLCKSKVNRAAKKEV